MRIVVPKNALMPVKLSKNLIFKIIILILGIIIIGFFSAILNPIHAATTKIIPYQGKLTNTNGTNVTDGSYNFQILFYDALGSGTPPTGGSCVYSISGTCGTPTSYAVTVTNGIFYIAIGDSGTNSLSSVNFNQDLYMQVTIGSETLAPRKRIGGSAFTSLNSITDPTANLSLSMGSNTTTLTYGNATGASTNLFNITDTASNTGTGYLANFATASSSAAKPFAVIARGNTIIDTTATGGLTLGNSTAAQDVNFFSTSNKITSAGNLTLLGTVTTGSSGQFTVDAGGNVGSAQISAGGQVSATFQTADTFAGGFVTQKRGTTGNSSAAVTSSTELGYNSFYGWDGTAYGRGSFIYATTTQNWTNAAHGSTLQFWTTANGSTTNSPRLFIDQNGYVGVGNTGPSSLFSVGASNQFTVDSSGNLTTSGYVTASGAYTETTSTAGLYAGIVSSTPRILFANGNNAQNWQIDNNGGDFRWYTPGTTQMTLTTTSLSLPNKTINASGNASNTASALALSGSLYSGGTGTNTYPYFKLEPSTATAVSTWSTNGTFIGVNSANLFTGNFLDFHVYGGASVASLDYTGKLTVTSCTGCGGGSSTWNGITNPTGNQALTMGANTTAWTWNSATSTSNLFTLADGASNTGTGALLNIAPGSGSTIQPVLITNSTTTGTTGIVNVNSTGDRSVFEIASTDGIASSHPLFDVSGDNGSDKIFQFGLTTDSFGRMNFNADGSLSWGSGSAGRDVQLYRTGTNQLTIDNNAGGAASLVVNGTLSAGTSSQFQVSSAGNVSTSGTISTSANGAASTPGLRLSGTLFTGGSASTTSPLLQVGSVAGTAWNTSGTVIGANVGTFSGNLLDLQINNTSKAKIDSTGALTSNGAYVSAVAAATGAGTVSTTAGSGAVTGVGTSFSNYTVGDSITVGTETVTIQSISSNTSMVTNAFQTTNAAGTAYSYAKSPLSVQTNSGTYLWNLNNQGTLTANIQGNNNALVLSAPQTGITSGAATIFSLVGASSSSTNVGKAFEVKVSGESFARGMFYTDGSYGIGPGTGNRDVFLYRSAANTFKIDSDRAGGTGNLIVTGNINVGSCTGCGGGGSTWNTISNPTGNQALTMAAWTSTWTYNAATGAGVNLFNVTDTASNTGTGYLVNFATASSSAAKPFSVGARGNTIIDTTATGGLTLGNSTAAQDVNFFSTSNKIASTGALTLTPSVSTTNALTITAASLTSGAGISVVGNALNGGSLLNLSTTASNIGSGDIIWITANNLQTGTGNFLDFEGATSAIVWDMGVSRSLTTGALFRGSWNGGGLTYAQYVHTVASETGSLFDIRLEDGSTLTSGTSTSNVFSAPIKVSTTGAGTKTINGFTIPSITLNTCTSGACTVNGFNVTTATSGALSTITQNAFNVNATGVSAGTLNGINVGSITSAGGTETGINIGSGWDNGLTINGTTSYTSQTLLNLTGASYNQSSGTSNTSNLANFSFTNATVGVASSVNVVNGLNISANVTSGGATGTSLTTNGINIATTINTTGALGKAINGINIATPTKTACTTGACTWTGLNIAAPGTLANTTFYGATIGGKVGIGTTAPTSTLHLKDTNSQINFEVTGDSNIPTISVQDNGFGTPYFTITSPFTNNNSPVVQFRDGYNDVFDVGTSFTSSYVRTGFIIDGSGYSQASTAYLQLNGTTFTGGTGTTTYPGILMQPYQNASSVVTNAVSTWSTAGTMIGLNGQSGFTGNFLDFHVHGGASVASLDYTGKLTVTSCTGCGGGGYALVKDETTSLTARTTLSFLGAGVTCVDNSTNSATECTINGGGSATTISGLTAAAGVNTIANANFAQTWNWGTLTTQTGLTLGGGTAMTTGSIAQLGSATFTHTAAETGQLLNISFTDTSTIASGTSNSSGINIAPTFNATSGAGTRYINGIKLGPVTKTACSAGSCIGAAINVDSTWDTDFLLAADTTDAPTPPTDTLSVYTKKVAGRVMLKAKGPTGVNYVYQPSLFQQNVVMMNMTASTTVLNGFGTSITALGGTLSSVVSEAGGYMKNFTLSTAAQMGVYTTDAIFYRGSVSGGASGYFFFARTQFPDASYANSGTTTGSRIFVGLTDQTTTVITASDNPAGNRSGFSYVNVNGGVTNTTWRFSMKDGTTENNIDTTMALTQNKVYDMYIYTPPVGTTVYWRIDNVTDGTTQEGSSSTNMPTNTVAMRAAFAETSINAVARNIRLQRMYIETDR